MSEVSFQTWIEVGHAKLVLPKLDDIDRNELAQVELLEWLAETREGLKKRFERKKAKREEEAKEREDKARAEAQAKAEADAAAAGPADPSITG